ncbi:MAG: acetyl-CoA carboxylase biotin carboxyl carrier protein [Phycisphaerales bacterium]|nr:acetyl-CoA carboxylase biotin carboxyl carrier protein [Phycisphaerales bacterium]
MDIEEIRTLTDLMVNNDLSEIMIRDGEKRIMLRRQGPIVEQVLPAPVPGPAPAVSPALPAAAPVPDVATPSEAKASEDADLKPIKSPMVGTYYSAPDPDSPPFVKVGDHVDKDTVICIIVAMKVNNDIKAGIAGTIESIDVTNETPVDCGHVLMKVRPN